MHLPIVGARHRPPADTILGNLPGDTPLLLVREPENEYDQNAVMVCLPPGWQAALSPEGLRELQEIVTLTGNEWPSDEEMFQLGYVPKALAAEMAPKMDQDGEPVECKLIFGPGGNPMAGGLEEEEEEDETT